MGERAVFSIMAHVFQIDQETKRKWIPSSSSAVRVSYYHDPNRKTYRIIAIDDVKALVNSTITANMNFTKTSPKFGQWSDHRANTVYGLGFSSEKELLEFIDMFTEAKQAARELMKERQLSTQRLQEQEKPHPPAGSSPSPTSPPVKSPSIVSPPASTSSSTSKSPSPSLTSPGLSGPLGPMSVNAKTTPSGSDLEKETSKEVNNETRAGRKSSRSDIEGSRSPVQNGGTEPMDSLKVVSNGHSSLGDVEASLESQLEAQKSENNRLKMALASSSTNVRKWESELQTMKNNNTRLQAALEESKQHLSQWKTQLQKYKEENDALKKKVQHLEEQKKMEADEVDVLRRDNEELKDVLGSVQTELEVKTEEAQSLEKQLDHARREAHEAQASLQDLKEESTEANEQITVLEDQLKMASVASKRKMEDVRMRQNECSLKLKELMRMHSDLEGFMDT